MLGMIGQIIADRYRIERLLGQGGMGMIYEAEDRQTGTLVAIKVMHDHLANRAKFRDRFVQEARSVADLDHPNIVRVIDHSPGAERLYIVMELVSGGSLRDYVNRLGRVTDYADATHIVGQIAEALHYAHENRVIHRDVKPENILLQPVSRTSGGLPYRCMLTDFGLAKLTDNIGYTLTGRPFGTYPYMSPEQFKTEPIDRRTDIYALGIVLFELVTGKLPYEPQTIFEAYQMHVKSPLPEPQRLRQDIPSSLQRIMLTCLAKSREARYQTAYDLANDLRRASLDLQGGFITEADFDNVAVSPQNPSIPSDSVPLRLSGTSSINVTEANQLQESRYGTDASLKPVPQVLRADSIRVSDGADGSFVFPISGDRVHIGRSPHMDITLKGRYISREHAVVERRVDGSYWVRLNAGVKNPLKMNGFPVGTDRASLWNFGEDVIIGDATLTLTPAMDAFADPATIEDITPPLIGVDIAEREGQTIHVTLEPRNQLVRPGEETVFRVNIENTGDREDEVALQIRGLPAEWAYITQEIIRVGARSSIETAIRFHPPKETSSRASRHVFTLRVHSTIHRLEICKINGMVHLEPFQHFTASLYPKRLENGGIITLRIRNEGNMNSEFRIEGLDHENALSFTIENPVLRIEPGESADVQIDVKPDTNRLVHGGRVFNFTISVHAMDGETQWLHGELIAVTNLIYLQERIENERQSPAPVLVPSQLAPAPIPEQSPYGPELTHTVATPRRGLYQWFALCVVMELLLMLAVFVQIRRLVLVNVNNFAWFLLFGPMLIFLIFFTLLYGFTLVQAINKRQWAAYTLIILSIFFGIISAQVWDWERVGIVRDIILTFCALIFGLSSSIFGWIKVQNNLDYFEQ